MRNGISLLYLALFLTACAGGENGYLYYLQKRGVTPPQNRTFHHCHDYGCQSVSEITLTKSEWAMIAKIFQPPAASAKAERKKIAKAIGALERLTGPKDGTAGDIAGTFRKSGSGQLDCIDESTNTTTYLALLQQHNLLRYHTLRAPTMRLPLVNAGRWPHQTAVIAETKTGVSYAVDSWFHDNGVDAEIIDLKTWKSGWKPESVRDFL